MKFKKQKKARNRAKVKGYYKTCRKRRTDKSPKATLSTTKVINTSYFNDDIGSFSSEFILSMSSSK